MAAKAKNRARSGWRRRTAQREAEIVHRWQSADVPSKDKWQQKDGRGKRIILLALLAAAIGLVAIYVRSLLLSPMQTPVVIVTGGPYPAPFAPNAWASSDANALKDLDGKTLSVLRTNSINDLESMLRSALQRQRGCPTVVIVLSMHGGVDEAGNPCLIPPSGSPLDPKTWIPLSVVLAHIQRSGIGDDVQKLLVLDCNRVRVSWEQGTIYNLFTESLELSQVVSKSEIPNLVVLNSARPGQRGWATEQLQGTVFGHFLRQGMSGAADAKSEGGNGDRSVSFEELRRYLDHHVDQWVTHHLAERQRPLVLTSGGDKDVPDFHVAWALRDSLPEKQLSEPVVSQAEINKYWEQHDRYREFEPTMYDPLTWAEYQRTLLRLQRTANAGPGYTVMARKAQVRLNELAVRLGKQQAAAIRPETLYANLETFSQFAGSRVQPLNLYSLPLSKYLGALSDLEMKPASTLLDEFKRSPTSETLQSHLKHESARTLIADLDEVHFLRLLHRYAIAELWPEADLARLMELRTLAAASAVPHDERVHPWVQRFVGEGDRSRRLAENAIFSGPRQSSPDWERHRQAAETAYGKAGALAKSLSGAYQLRDRISAELPWLANWLLHRPFVVTTESPDADTPVKTLFRLILAKRELDEALRKPGDASPIDVIDRCTEDFERLNALYDLECRSLLNAEQADAKTLRRIHAVLEVPLVPSGQRAEFRGKRVDSRRRLKRAAGTIAEKLTRTYQPVAALKLKSDAESSKSTTSTAAADLLIRLDLLDRLGKGSAHPVLSLLDASEDPSKADPPNGPESERDTVDSVKRLAGAQTRFQERLLEIAQVIGRTQNAAETDPQAYRGLLLNAEEALRKFAAFPLPQLRIDPNARRRRFDLQQLLVWHADRAIEDFWGSANNDERPFFQRSATGYWESAVDFDTGFAGIFKQRTSAREWLGRRVAASKSGITTNVTPPRQLSPGENVDVAVSVSAVPTAAGGPHARTSLPPGTGSVFLADGRGRIGKQLQPVPIPHTRDSKQPLAMLKFQLGDGTVSNRAAGLSAVTLYRGHAFSAPLSVGMPGGVTVSVQPKTATHSLLTLTGTKENPASIVFVLDCSQSMNRKTAQAGGPTRMEVAVKALGELMDQLVKRGNTQVGVVFYGHRAGWNSDGTEIVRQTAYDLNIDKEMLPLEDVEIVATLGRFDGTAANFVKSRMKRLQPWGETPLFLSITEAIKQLAVADADSNRRIVVITDGENNQYVPRDLQLTEKQTAKLAVLEDVTGTLRKNPIPVHILGFEMSDDEARRSQIAFQQITQVSGGTYVPAVNARVLFPTLESLLGPSRYSVFDESGKTLESATLGGTVRLDIRERRRRVVSVAVGTARATVPLDGGEAFQLMISKSGNAIESVRYTTGQPRFAPLVIGEFGAASGVLAGAHLPSRGGTDRRDVTFPISFQREDRAVTPRFDDVWTEITPLGKDGQPIAEPYVFLDTNYVDGMPVPVMNLLAANWPKNATKGAIRIWCHPRRTQATKTIDVANLLAPAQSKQNPSTVEVAGNELLLRSSSSGGRFQLRVIERHLSRGRVYAPCRIEVNPKSSAQPAARITASRITRRFDVKNRVTVHTFEFPADAEAAVRSGTLAVTTRESVVGAHARQLAQPLVIEVTKPGGVIRLNGPALPK